MTDQTLDGELSETYLQISSNILESFPKFRPPVDMYFFDEDVAQVKRIHQAEARMGTEMQAQVMEYANDSLLFLLREDYQVYASHLSQKLGLVLVEDDLRAQEVAEIFFLAFRDRMRDFLDQPKVDPLKKLIRDISILAEYLWADPGRTECLTKSLYKDNDLAVHSVNTMFIGMALFMLITKGKAEKGTLVNMALGLLVHDLGMTNVPKFILDSDKYLLKADRDSIEKHLDAGASKLKRLGVKEPVVLQCLTQHHERLDGSGYPLHLKGAKISLPGKLCGIADAFAAMIAERPYREAKDFKVGAVTLLKEKAKFEPALIALLYKLVGENGSARKSDEVA